MQIISYCIKLDYFYYKNDEENILKQTDEVKKVCLRLDNLKYYYFAWGRQTYYLLLIQGKEILKDKHDFVFEVLPN